MHKQPINQDKCASFSKYMSQYEKKNRLSYPELWHLVNLSANHFMSTHTKHEQNKYDEWTAEHEVNLDLLATVATEEYNKIKLAEITPVFIDISLNTISDLIKIINAHPYKENVKYNIDLKMLHSIKDELVELDSMIGIKTFKTAILDQLLYYIQGFHVGSCDDYKHTVLYGPPGSGKTEIAKIMGRMYSKMGVIKKPPPPSNPISENKDLAALFAGCKTDDKKFAVTAFKKITRTDLVAGYVGQTALKTKAIINECLGGVIFLDEAYSLGGKDNGDVFSKECVDILCESLSNHKENLMFIIAGYEKELNEHFFSMNPGLDSRFVWRFNIDKYTPSELWQIFCFKVKKMAEWKIDESLVSIGEDWFKRNFEHFTALGRDVETLLFKTKIAHSRRLYGADATNKFAITLQDLNAGFDEFKKSKTSNKDKLEKQRIYHSLYA